MRFSSKPWMTPGVDDRAGMYYYGYRFYDPLTQRWLNRDRINDLGFQEIEMKRHGEMVEEDLNLFSFAANNPITSVDYLGLQVKRRHNCAPCKERHFSAAGFATRDACANAYFSEMTSTQVAAGLAGVGTTVLVERAVHMAAKSTGTAAVGVGAVGGVSVGGIMGSTVAIGAGLQWLIFYDVCSECVRSF